MFDVLIKSMQIKISVQICIKSPEMFYAEATTVLPLFIGYVYLLNLMK